MASSPIAELLTWSRYRTPHPARWAPDAARIALGRDTGVQGAQAMAEQRASANAQVGLGELAALKASRQLTDQTPALSAALIHASAAEHLLLISPGPQVLPRKTSASQPLASLTSPAPSRSASAPKPASPGTPKGSPKPAPTAEVKAATAPTSSATAATKPRCSAAPLTSWPSKTSFSNSVASTPCSAAKASRWT